MRRPLLPFLFVFLGCLGSPPAPSGPGPAFVAEVHGKGPPLVLVAGMVSPPEVWAPVVSHFAGRYQVHVLTLAGAVGNPSIPAPYLITLRDALGRYVEEHHLDRPAVVGHSFGGIVTLALAEQRPALLGAVVSVDGSPFAPALSDPDASAQSMKMKMKASIMRRALAGLGPLELGAMWRKLGPNMVLRNEDVDRLARWAERSDARELAQATFEAATTDLRPELGKVRVPLLLVGTTALAHDEDPAPVFARYQEQLAFAPRAQFVFASHAKHFVMLDDPDFLNATLDAFLERAESRRGEVVQ